MYDPRLFYLHYGFRSGLNRSYHRITFQVFALMAEYIFAHWTTNINLRARASSAGTYLWDGSQAQSGQDGLPSNYLCLLIPFRCNDVN